MEIHVKIAILIHQRCQAPERNFKGISTSVLVGVVLFCFLLQIIFYIKQALFILVFLSKREKGHKNGT